MSTIHIQCGKNNFFHNSSSCKIQSVPFKIHADCDANVARYFNNYLKEENDVLVASFRGYPLRGKNVELPKQYVGVVLHESIKPTREKDSRKFYIINNFSSLTFWNWDKITSNNDSLTQALEWVDIAEVLHSPVSEE